MKNLIKFLITLSIITTFVACDFDYSVKKTALDATLQNSNATTKNTSENANSAKFSVASCNGTLTNNKDQEIVVTFNNGYVDNSAANLAKIKVYTLANSTVSTVYTRTALTVKSTRVETTAGNSIVYLVLDLDVAAIADLLDVEIDPSITADGGAKTLNQDDDEVAGESDDDIYYKGFTLNDTNASMNLTYLTTGVQRLSPQTTFTLNLSPNATYDLVGTPSRTPYSSYTKDSLLGGFVLEKFNYSTLSWTSASVTSGFDTTTGLFTVDLPSPNPGDAYRWSRKLNLVSQATAYTGYLLKASYDDNLGYTTPAYINMDNSTNNYFDGTSIAVTKDADSVKSAVKVAFTTATVGSVVLDSTVTSSAIEVFIAGTAEKVGISSIVKESDNNYKLYLNKSVENFGSSNVKVVVYPTIKTDNATPADTTDDRHFGVIGNPAARVSANSGV